MKSIRNNIITTGSESWPFMSNCVWLDERNVIIELTVQSNFNI